MSFDAVIFDLDGTLVDSEALALAAGHRAAQQLGIPFKDQFFTSLIGTDGRTSKARLEAEYGVETAAAFGTAWFASSRALKAEGLAVKPGVTDLLDLLETRGLPRAVATSSGRGSAESSLAVTGLANRFVTVVTRDCVNRAKPHPEPYLTAAERLDVDPTRCLVFEDSTPGAKAGRAAGMTVVLVPDLAPVEAGHAHHVADDVWHGARLAGLF